jgi:hypothetical protein
MITTYVVLSSHYVNRKIALNLQENIGSAGLRMIAPDCINFVPYALNFVAL